MRARQAEQRAVHAELRLKSSQEAPIDIRDATLTRESQNPSTGQQSISAADFTFASPAPIVETGSGQDSTDESASYEIVSLENPPSQIDDFNWDEQSALHAPKETEASRLNADSAAEEEHSSPLDGMASLTVEERGAGYLGTASGAAMLRLLLPEGDHIRSLAACRGAPPETGEDSNAAMLWEDLRSSQSFDTDIDLDAAINAYFSLYHLSYPVVHEPTFRSQYMQTIPRPAGACWVALAYTIAAIGLFSTATTSNNDDLKLFEAAKSKLSIDNLESGNITLVQVLILMSNYLQKRGKPNSGYNYLGLALHTAMGLGMHKEFHNWNISPLAIETRRRVWWVLHVFYVGAVITFGRPLSFPEKGVETLIPLNIHDRDLTSMSLHFPKDRETFTPYTAVIYQARFHSATNSVYARTMTTPSPTASELLRLDELHLGGWLASLPPWYAAEAIVPPKFALSHYIMFNRFRNFRIITFRPFVIHHMLRSRSDTSTTRDEEHAVALCLREARGTIESISKYWSTGIRCRLSGWYSLYFLFQAALIPCFCLRNDPFSSLAADWKIQIETTLRVIKEMTIMPSSHQCYSVILRLCGTFLSTQGGGKDSFASEVAMAAEESPQTQLDQIYSMMWPGNGIDSNMQDMPWTMPLGFTPQETDWMTNFEMP
ncbi:hypothetical protein M8818_002279 [Zalaria obscura]|uniref:Uncharacterized protein n=1 Tax=Zalaria obscura TaxID=2024903 RepID=A0ACC3SLU5_9PEZI